MKTRTPARGWRLGALILLFHTAALQAGTAERICNFTQPLPSTAELQWSVAPDQARVGLAAGRLDYTCKSPGATVAQTLPTERFRLPDTGMLRFWCKGDGSENQLHLVLRTARVSVDNQGRRRHHDHRDHRLPPVALTNTDWHEVTVRLARAIRLAALPKGHVLWWHRIEITSARGEEARLAGTVFLDDLRLEHRRAPSVAIHAGLVGPSVRRSGDDLALALDIRNDTDKSAALKTHLTMTDRNENVIVERAFTTAVRPQEHREVALAIEPEALERFLPPFRISGDVLSPDLPDLTAEIDATVVCINSKALFTAQGDVYSDWNTRAWDRNRRGLAWATVGETHRLHAQIDTHTRYRRVPVTPDEAGKRPPTPHAVALTYRGEAMLCNAKTKPERFFPGNAVQMGLWVRGDGSDNRLVALLHDYSNMADFWHGGWKKVIVDQTVCRLSFTGWRYIEIPLPGRGQGSNSPRGSTDGIDFPLELGGLAVVPDRSRGEDEPLPPPSTLQIGPIYALTQQALADTLSLDLAYERADRRWDTKANATAVVQNAFAWEERTIHVRWRLNDRDDRQLAQGEAAATLAGGAAASLPLTLATAAAAKDAPGPLKLTVSASVQDDPTISVTRALCLAKPDSALLLADFEEERDYLALKAKGVPWAPPTGTAASRPTTAQAKGGQRSLPLPWQRDQEKTPFVAVDPPLPGPATRLTLWLYGDGSGVLFYPLLGDQRGINSGVPSGTWDILLARPQPADGIDALQQAVRVDWTGWRQLTFDLPPIPATWNEGGRVQAFAADYPLGLHLGIRAAAAKAESGTLYIDDIRVETHLAPEERLSFDLVLPTESNIIAPDATPFARVQNADRSATRTARLRATITDWLGRDAVAVEQELTLAPGAIERVPLGEALAPGAYYVRAVLSTEATTFPAATADLLVAPLAAVTGAAGPEALADPYRLRLPIGEDRGFLDEDWDWVEYYPGNFQFMSSRRRLAALRGHGIKPYHLLGYSAYWAAGPAYEARQAGRFHRRYRHVGQGVDVFMPPRDLADWENYVIEMMRTLGREVAGWIFWRNPESSGPIGIPPERFLEMLKLTDRWHQAYCPQTPLLIGDMNRETCLPYLAQLAELGGLEYFDGVNVRVDVGRLAPEDAQVVRFVQAMKQTLRSTPEAPKHIWIKDLDWAVEETADGLDAFDQAAYLSRAALLLGREGLQSTLSITNDDRQRRGLGLAYRRSRHCPPMTEQPATFLLKPAWWAVYQTRRLLDTATPYGEVPIRDRWPGRTRCLLLAPNRKKTLAVVWRNNDPGHLDFAATGLQPGSARDLFATPIAPREGRYPVGRMPVVFELAVPCPAAAEALRLLQVGDGTEPPTWAQALLAAFPVQAGTRWQYQADTGTASPQTGAWPKGTIETRPLLRLPAGASETFRVEVPNACGLALRKTYFLDDRGQVMTVQLDGKPVGTWDLGRREAAFSSGWREAVTFLTADQLGGARQVTLQVTYPEGGNSAGWAVHPWRGEPVDLVALGPIHAEQPVTEVRWCRNAVGNPLRLGTETVPTGIGAYAASLLEYAVEGQFSRFTAQVGIDAATEGKGSVVFEVQGDGKKLWTSPVVSGLDKPLAVDIDIRGVKRLRLLVHDGGDGNKFDAADWCSATLTR